MTLTVNTSGHTLPNSDYFNAVAISLGGPSDSATLTSVLYTPDPTIDSSGFHVKAIWVNSYGSYVDQISKGFSGWNDDPPPPTVPKPASMMLLGSGLAAAAARLRRQKS